MWYEAYKMRSTESLKLPHCHGGYMGSEVMVHWSLHLVGNYKGEKDLKIKSKKMSRKKSECKVSQKVVDCKRNRNTFYNQ